MYELIMYFTIFMILLLMLTIAWFMTKLNFKTERASVFGFCVMELVYVLALYYIWTLRG